MTLYAHVEAIQEKHQALESLIQVESRCPSPDLTMLQNLKKKKLLLKEELERARLAITRPAQAA